MKSRKYPVPKTIKAAILTILLVVPLGALLALQAQAKSGVNTGAFHPRHQRGIVIERYPDGGLSPTRCFPNRIAA